MILKKRGVGPAPPERAQREPSGNAGGNEPHRTRRHVPLAPGTILQGRYRIVSVLGVGGMSTVHRALDLRFANVERVCAIKEMFDNSGDDRINQQRTAAFEREAGLLAVLSHQLIPKIFDFFSEGGNHYLVQEFIPGQNLETYLESHPEPLPESQLIDWGVVLCDVLSYLHNQQPNPIIFRDLKPSNIMIRDDSSLMLIDFGIARTFQQLERGTMIGTEGYAPPEQYRGTADSRTDIYALGATLHHLATRVDPRFETPFTFDQRPVRSVNPHLKPEFEAVLARALAYASKDRFESAAEFKAALLRCRAGTPHFRPTPAPEAAPGSGPLPRPTPVRARPLLTRASTTKQPLATPEQRPAKRATAGGTRLSSGTAITDRLIWSLRTGDEVRGGGCLTDNVFLIGSYDANLYALDPISGSVAWQFATGRGICSRPAVWRDLAIIGSEDGAVYGVTLENGRRKWRYRTNMPVRSSPRVSPLSGELIVGSDDSYVYRLDPSTGTLLWRYRTYGTVRSSAAITEHMAIIGSDDGFLYALALDTGRQIWRFATSKPVQSSPVVEHGIVIFGSIDGSIYGLGSESGELRWRIETGGPVIASAVVSDGSAYIGSSSGHYYAIDVASGKPQWNVTHGGRVTSSAAVSDDCIYFGGLDGTVSCLERRSGTLVWSHSLGRPITASTDLYLDLLLVGSTDGKIYALSTGEGGGVAESPTTD